MTDQNYIYHETEGVPVKTWTKGVPVEDAAMDQLRNVAALPFIHKHVAAMADCHWGIGATVGSVIVRRRGKPRSRDDALRLGVGLHRSYQMSHAVFEVARMAPNRARQRAHRRVPCSRSSRRHFSARAALRSRNASAQALHVRSLPSFTMN